MKQLIGDIPAKFLIKIARLKYGLTFSGNKMKLQGYLFCSLLLISSCSNKIQNEGYVNAGIVMNLSANKTKISQSEKTVNLLVSVKNTSADCRYILNPLLFYTFEPTTLLLIIEKGQNRKYDHDIFIHLVDPPKTDEYTKLLPDDSLTFNHELDLSSLAGEYANYGHLNEDFGIYKIKVIYKDIYKDMSGNIFDEIYDYIFQIRKLPAISFLESNTIEIEYVQ